jgi:hypothetical protein
MALSGIGQSRCKDEELSANVLGKPCVGKLQARFDEKVLETWPRWRKELFYDSKE